MANDALCRGEDVMTRTLMAACGACAIAGLTAMAQTPASPPPTPSTQSASRTETSLTLIGCLQYWDGATDATRGASSTPARRPAGPGAKYMLSNVESRSQGGGLPATSYALTGDAKVNLAGHVNHKVQVSGTMAADDYGNPAQAPVRLRGQKHRRHATRHCRH
jgi:hypothetical protein